MILSCWLQLLAQKLINFVVIFFLDRKKVKVTSFERGTFSYSVIQPPFDINFCWPLCHIRKQVFRSFTVNLGKLHMYFNPSLVCSQHTAPSQMHYHWTNAPQIPSYKYWWKFDISDKILCILCLQQNILLLHLYQLKSYIFIFLVVINQEFFLKMFSANKW